MPVTTFDEMVFGHLEVTLLLEFLGNGLVGVFEKVLAVLADEADHIVVETEFLVHLDSQIGFIHIDVQFFSVLKIN